MTNQEYIKMGVISENENHLLEKEARKEFILSGKATGTRRTKAC